MNLRRPGSGLDSYVLSAERVLVGDRKILDEQSFQKTISAERKRTERSRKPFLLMLLQAGNDPATDKKRKLLRNIGSALLLSTRETDVTGWYKDNSTVGVMFTELAVEEKHLVLGTIVERITNTLRDSLTLDQFNQISISFHMFPEDWNHDLPQSPTNPMMYPDLIKRDKSQRVFRVMKRIMDVVGSLAAIIALSPLFLFIALAIKASSEGPVFFRQRRIGRHGKSFVFLKFRSMFVGNDASAHRDYVKQLIAGKAEKQSGKDGQGVYKLTKDPRVTSIGRFLRKTSLDELPQFANVLKGEMSLVGPRPPVPYEVEAYDIWHRRRLLEAKPGITGLWQVNGRSRVKFDEMVRLDLQYARNWTPWLDLKILLRTPAAVVVGEGAH